MLSVKHFITTFYITILVFTSIGIGAASAQPITSKVSPMSLLAQSPVSTQAMSPQTALERLLTAPEVKDEWFTTTFLSQVPTAQVQAIVSSLKAELGAYQAVRSQGSDYQIVFEKGIVPTKIVLTPNGQISGLLFQPPILKANNLDEVVAGFKALPGNVSLLVVEDGAEKVALNVNKPLAVGSAFKLAVLRALQLQVVAGAKSWRDVVELQPAWKSLPSGLLQNWADGSPLTLGTLAGLMISLSDNTATDALIHLTGRKTIEKISPRNRPFLTTREAFVLKSSKNQQLLKRYRSGDEATRRSLLTEVNKSPLPNVSEFLADPVALDVEWFFTAQELCNLMEQVKDLPVMSINPGVAKAEDWQKVAFKGGSEPGVLNLTTWLSAKNDKTYCISATWNHTVPLEESLFMGLYNSILEVLKR
jgi:beta-lactamase class A